MKTLHNIIAASLIEAALSIAIISLAITSVVLAYYQVAKAPQPSVTQRAYVIAQGYLEEILTQKFPTILPCPAPPAARTNYATVCDYNNLSNVGAYDMNGNAIPGTSDFNITVTLDTSTAATIGGLTGGATAAAANVVRIDVRVVHTIQGSAVPSSTLLMSAYAGKN